MRDVARVSAPHLRRQFQTHFRMTPREWLRRERIKLAQDLLGQAEASVTAIANTCGFYDIYHFSREFRRVVGQSPTEWRRAGAVKTSTAPRSAR
jgi:transcriptional regulator GlxA family with amidase domain